MLRVPLAPALPGHSSVGFARPVKIETLSIQATYDRMIEGGVTHVAAADMILRYHGIDVERTKWYKSRSDKLQLEITVADSREVDVDLGHNLGYRAVVTNTEACVAVDVSASLGSACDATISGVSSSIEKSVLCDNETSSEQLVEHISHVGTSEVVDVDKDLNVDPLLNDSSALGFEDDYREKESSQRSQGYCYLLMFKHEHRESLALRFGPYPWLSELAILPQQVWDFDGLDDCELVCYDQVAHLRSGINGHAQIALKERFRQIGFDRWGETFDDGHGFVVDKANDFQLGGNVRIGSIGDLSDYDVLRGLLKQEIVIPIVYASLHNYVRHQHRRELLDLQPVDSHMITHGLDTYEYRGHSKRSLIVLMPGQFVCASGVLVGSNSVCVGVVIPPNSVMTMLQRRGFSEQSSDMSVRVIRIPDTWDSTHLALPDTSTKARFAANEAGFYLHSGLPATANISVLSYTESVSINDPFDPYSAVSDTRHTVSHDGSLSVRLSNAAYDAVTVLDSFRVRQEQDAEFSICDILHIYDDEASVAVNTAAMDIVLSTDRILRNFVDDFSFHRKVLLDEYTYDGGGPSDEEGFPPAFGDYREITFSSEEYDGGGLHWLDLSDSEGEI